MENNKNLDAYRHHNMVTGCQLLIDNRSRESGAVVVVPSDEWEAMRRASIASSQAATLSEPGDTETEIPEVTIESTPGSETIIFSNYTSCKPLEVASQLALLKFNIMAQ